MLIWLYAAGAVDLERTRRFPPAGDRRAAARAPAASRRARRADRPDPARNLQAPARAPGGGTGERAHRCPAARVRARVASARRARRVAGAVPAPVGSATGGLGAAPGPEGKDTTEEE